MIRLRRVLAQAAVGVDELAAVDGGCDLHANGTSLGIRQVVKGLPDSSNQVPIFTRARLPLLFVELVQRTAVRRAIGV